MSYILWGHLMYIDYCGVLATLVHKMVPYIYSVICMGPSFQMEYKLSTWMFLMYIKTHTINIPEYKSRSYFQVSAHLYRRKLGMSGYKEYYVVSCMQVVVGRYSVSHSDTQWIKSLGMKVAMICLLWGEYCKLDFLSSLFSREGLHMLNSLLS